MERHNKLGEIQENNNGRLCLTETLDCVEREKREERWHREIEGLITDNWPAFYWTVNKLSIYNQEYADCLTILTN